MRDWVSAGNGLLQGVQVGYGIARMKKRDEVDQQRYDDSLAYRDQRDALEQERFDDAKAYARGRDQVADARYQEGLDYQRGRDQVADNREEQRFGLQRQVHGAQMRNYNQQYEHAEADRQNSLQLRQLSAMEHLLKNGSDGGQLAALMNQDPQYAAWLKGRNLDGAAFDHFRFNDTGKGEPGMVTFIKGKDKQTGQQRRGVATVNASSDPDDPVLTMPMDAVWGLVGKVADDAEAAGEGERAEEVRKLFLQRIQAQKIALGGAAPAAKWGPIQDVPGVGPGQYDAEGQFHQMKTGRGYGIRSMQGSGAGGGSKSASARQAQLYRQLGDVFPDDDAQQIDNSSIRDLTVSLAQDFDLQVDGALAPGIYGQVAKEASDGLALSPAAAQKQAMDELNQGKYFGGADAEDPEVQERAASILQRSKAQYAERYTSALDQMLGARGGAGGSLPSRPAAQALPAVPETLDGAVKSMMDLAAAKGASISEDQARQYLVQKYPDRFGQPPVAESSPIPDAPQPRRWADIENDSADKRAVRAVEGAARTVVDGAKTGLAKLKQYGETEQARNRYSKAITMGQRPSAENLSEWLPHLEPADQEQALALMAELYPEDQLTQKAMREYNPLAAR